MQIPLTCEDPGKCAGKPEEMDKYHELNRQIATKSFILFQKSKIQWLESEKNYLF